MPHPAIGGFEPTEPRRLSIRLPRPLWLFGLTVTLIVLALGLRIGAAIHRQGRALQAIERVGGGVGTCELGPKWLRDCVGDSWMMLIEEVSFVSLSEAPDADGALAHVADFRNLEAIDLGLSDVSDAGLAHLARLTKLKALDLYGTRVTDTGLAHLTGLTKLEALKLNRTQVTDVGLVHLNNLTNLEELSLDYTSVTDAGLSHLKGLSKLKWLDLDGTRVTAGGVAELATTLPGAKIGH